MPALAFEVCDALGRECIDSQSALHFRVGAGRISRDEEAIVLERHAHARAVAARRSLPAYLVEVGRRPLIAGQARMSLAGQRAMTELLDTVLTRLRQSGTLLNQYAAKLHATGQIHGGLDALLAYHRQTVDRLAALLDQLDDPR